jgi:hypothetical protein
MLILSIFLGRLLVFHICGFRNLQWDNDTVQICRICLQIHLLSLSQLQALVKHAQCLSAQQRAALYSAMRHLQVQLAVKEDAQLTPGSPGTRAHRWLLTVTGSTEAASLTRLPAEDIQGISGSSLALLPIPWLDHLSRDQVACLSGEQLMWLSPWQVRSTFFLFLHNVTFTHGV